MHILIRMDKSAENSAMGRLQLYAYGSSDSEVEDDSNNLTLPLHDQRTQDNMGLSVTDADHKIMNKKACDVPMHRRTLHLQRLPVPPELSSLFSEAKVSDPKDNPDHHDGRIRSFPHERGNWSTAVYIQFDPLCMREPFSSDDKLWNAFQQLALSKCSDQNIDLKLIPEQHISLSRTVILRHHWIQPFIHDLQTAFQPVQCFRIWLSGFKVYINEEKSRTFLGLQVSSGVEKLTELTQLTNATLKEFKQPPYYEDMSFHASIAWCLGNQKEALVKRLPVLEESMLKLGIPAVWPCDVEHVSCSTGGSKYYKFSLLKP